MNGGCPVCSCLQNSTKDGNGHFVSPCACINSKGHASLLIGPVLSGAPAPFPAGGVGSHNGYDIKAAPHMFCLLLAPMLTAMRAPFPRPATTQPFTALAYGHLAAASNAFSNMRSRRSSLRAHWFRMTTYPARASVCRNEHQMTAHLLLSRSGRSQYAPSARQQSAVTERSNRTVCNSFLWGRGGRGGNIPSI
jgi:hypothetical protein